MSCPLTVRLHDLHQLSGRHTARFPVRRFARRMLRCSRGGKLVTAVGMVLLHRRRRTDKRIDDMIHRRRHRLGRGFLRLRARLHSVVKTIHLPMSFDRWPIREIIARDGADWVNDHLLSVRILTIGLGFPTFHVMTGRLVSGNVQDTFHRLIGVCIDEHTSVAECDRNTLCFDQPRA